jgi:hypothetical protein
MVVRDGNHYRPERKTLKLFSRSSRQRGAVFAVPLRVPPGKYLVVIFDGTEGGSHYTWDVFTVVAQGSPLPSKGVEVLPTLIVAGAALIVGYYLSRSSSAVFPFNELGDP